MTHAPADVAAPAHVIRSIEELEALYGEPSQPSLAKEIDHVNAHYRAFLEAAPFVALATAGPEGLDCSPRGDPRGFVDVSEDGRTLLIPDRRGNNRVDSLRNIVRDGRVALLFLIPGVGETLRINGRAVICTDPDLLARFAINGKAPRSLIRIDVASVYFQCSKAVVRSRLWSPEARVDRAALPSTGTMLELLSAGALDGEEYDRNYPRRLAETTY